MKNTLKTVMAIALMLGASSVLADIVFFASSGKYVDPDLASVSILASPDVYVRTTGLNGELAVNASDLPGGLGSVEQSCATLPFEQELDLNVDRSRGVVEGRSRGRIHFAQGEVWNFRAEVRGNASCLPFNGRRCGQLVVDLDLRGTLSSPENRARIGLIRMHALGSLVRDGGSAQWVALAANTSLGFALPDDVAELLCPK